MNHYFEVANGLTNLPGKLTALLPDNRWREKIIHVPPKSVLKTLFHYDNLEKCYPIAASSHPFLPEWSPPISRMDGSLLEAEQGFLFVPTSRSPHNRAPWGDSQGWKREPQPEREFTALLLLFFFLSLPSAFVFILGLIDYNGGKLFEQRSYFN